MVEASGWNLEPRKQSKRFVARTVPSPRDKNGTPSCPLEFKGCFPLTLSASVTQWHSMKLCCVVKRASFVFYIARRQLQLSSLDLCILIVLPFAGYLDVIARHDLRLVFDKRRKIKARCIQNEELKSHVWLVGKRERGTVKLPWYKAYRSLTEGIPTSLLCHLTKKWIS